MTFESSGHFHKWNDVHVDFASGLWPLMEYIELIMNNEVSSQWMATEDPELVAFPLGWVRMLHKTLSVKKKIKCVSTNSVAKDKR